jgi:hypothetical protein
MIAQGGDHFATQIDIDGGGINSYCLTAMFRGQATLDPTRPRNPRCGQQWPGLSGHARHPDIGERRERAPNLWFEALVLEHARKTCAKTVVPFAGDRGFESLPLRHFIDLAP